MKHQHSASSCPAHVAGCDCPDLPGNVCNPYWVPGHCPDDLEVMAGG